MPPYREAAHIQALAGIQACSTSTKGKQVSVAITRLKNIFENSKSPVESILVLVYNNCITFLGVCAVKYLSVKETSIKWNITVRRVLQYLKDCRIDGAYMMGSTWAIPEDAVKPTDPRKARKNTD